MIKNKCNKFINNKIKIINIFTKNSSIGLYYIKYEEHCNSMFGINIIYYFNKNMTKI